MMLFVLFCLIAHGINAVCYYDPDCILNNTLTCEGGCLNEPCGVCSVIIPNPQPFCSLVECEVVCIGCVSPSLCIYKNCILANGTCPSVSKTCISNITLAPTVAPTAVPTNAPVVPSLAPTRGPTIAPSRAPTTAETMGSTPPPTPLSTSAPTRRRTGKPTTRRPTTARPTTSHSPTTTSNSPTIIETEVPNVKDEPALVSGIFVFFGVAFIIFLGVLLYVFYYKPRRKQIV